MRINKVVAERLSIARRKADELIQAGQITINGQIAAPGSQIQNGDIIAHAGKVLKAREASKLLVALNKPVGYVCSRQKQGRSPTIFDTLPPEYQHLNPIGRLDKDSSGLLLLTNDGELANQLSHPRYAKTKVYEVTLDKALLMHDEQAIQTGVVLDDGPSKLSLSNMDEHGTAWRVTMQEGRNRQIRRTFAARGYGVSRLHRVQFGPYDLGDLPDGKSLLLSR